MNELKNPLYTNLYCGKNTPMGGQVLELLAAAKARGLTVSRWQANRGNHACTVTWAAHKGKRPTFSSDLPDDAHIVRFEGLEGKTGRSRSFKSIAHLIEEIRASG